MPSTILLFDIEQVPRSMLTGDKFIFIIRYRHPLDTSSRLGPITDKLSHCVAMVHAAGF